MLRKVNTFQQCSQHPLFYGFLLLLATLLFTLPVQANGLDQLLSNQPGQQKFIPVEEAFQVDGTVTDGKAIIQFTVAPGHYLYKKRFSFSSVSEDTILEEPEYPAGKKKFDDNFGEVMEVFDHSVQVALPITSNQSIPEILVRFQGCAEAGLCYPPHTVSIPLVVTDNSLMPATARASTQSPQERLQTPDRGFLTSLLLFLLAGIGLTFTPCVLPMVPILSSILVGNSQASKARILALTLAYVLSMSIAFAIAGTLMGMFGASLNLQAKLQSPWLIVPFAFLFVLLSLSMFGLYELQLPEKFRNKLVGSPQSRGSLSGAMVMGLLSALVVSPCVSAPLAGALIYISTTGDAVSGGLSLFAMGLGMGVPLLVIGIGSRQLLPKAGAWMDSVKTFFGFMLLAVAIWMLERVIPGQITLLLWGLLLITVSVRLKTFTRMPGEGLQIIAQVLGIAFLIYGACLIIGAAKGNVDPLRPLASPLSLARTTGSPALQFTRTNSIIELDHLLQTATNQQQSVMIDIYADWCLPCKVMERSVFPSSLVRESLAEWKLIKLDITRNTPEQQKWLNQQQLFGPPALLFMDVDGKEVKRVIGEINARDLAKILNGLKRER